LVGAAQLPTELVNNFGIYRHIEKGLFSVTRKRALALAAQPDVLAAGEMAG
jgi:hypothetical protein